MLFEQILLYCDKHHLIPANSVIIVGLSGGPDSVFLLHFLAHGAQKRNLTLIAAHLDHQWRADSYKDVQLCVRLCQELEIPLITKKVSELEMPAVDGTPEQKGRAYRRFFFEQVLREHKGNHIALAHHQQDQQETFFIRMIRGATLSGLASIRSHAGYYIRPLLHTSKIDILAYLHENNIKYIVDPTNNDDAMLRNRIRKQVIPALQSCDQRFDQNFDRMLNSLQETEGFLEQLTEDSIGHMSVLKDGTLYVDQQQFFAQQSYMQQRILLQLLIKAGVSFAPSQGLLGEIMRFLHNNKSVQHAVGDAWIVGKKRDCFFIKKN